MDTPQNPYLPPSSDLELPGGARPIILVSPGIRFMNLLIDWVICIVLQFGFGIVAVLLFQNAAVDHLQGCVGQIYGLLIFLAYYLLMEGFFSQTVGKMATRTIVVAEDGTKPSFKQILQRSFSRWIPFEAFSFFDKQSRGLHDKLAKTYVVKIQRQTS